MFRLHVSLSSCTPTLIIEHFAFYSERVRTSDKIPNGSSFYSIRKEWSNSNALMSLFIRTRTYHVDLFNLSVDKIANRKLIILSKARIQSYYKVGFDDSIFRAGFLIASSHCYWINHDGINSKNISISMLIGKIKTFVVKFLPLWAVRFRCTLEAM